MKTLPAPTHWEPELPTDNGPRYQALAQALAEDIESGLLAPGTRLPTQRDLARRLRVTVGTVGRAYAEAERRKLICGQVGRGTFVRSLESPARQLRVQDESGGQLIELSMNHPAACADSPVERELARLLRGLTEPGRLAPLLEYTPSRGLERHREAGARWIGRVLPGADPERVLVTCGAQHAMAAVFTAIARPGDLVLTEALTYSGMLVLADQLNLKLYGLSMDRHGLVPEAFEEACRLHAPRILYTIPTLQNPTATIMPIERRRRIAAIAERHGVTIVEDDVHGVLPDRPMAPIASLLENDAFYIANTSKSLAPGLRVGFVHAPTHRLEAVTASVQATTWMAPPLNAELVSRWIDEGAADRILALRREEAQVRFHLARACLQGMSFQGHPRGYHVWLELPDRWHASDLVQAARQVGIRLAPTEAFAVTRPAPVHRVRLCLGVEKSRERLRDGLEKLAGLLRDRPRRSHAALL